jgi:hypothetical protein
MFNSISWHQYFLFLILGLLLYYLFIWVVYFKARIPNFTRIKMNQEHSDEVLSSAQHIMEELRPVFARKINKQELIGTLQLKLKKYSQWNEPGFRESVNEFIAAESEQKCSIHLGVEDQRVLWLG